MARHRSAIWLGLAGLLARANAACTCSGTDYTHGGTYYIDENSEAYFKFSSVFQGKWNFGADAKPFSRWSFVLTLRDRLGCTTDLIDPVLISPNDDHYVCSTVNSGDTGNVQVSGWYVTATRAKTDEGRLTDYFRPQ
jgi:hypothetical protein